MECTLVMLVQNFEQKIFLAQRALQGIGLEKITFGILFRWITISKKISFNKLPFKNELVGMNHLSIQLLQKDILIYGYDQLKTELL